MDRSTAHTVRLALVVSLGGFIFVTLGRVPKRGEVVRHDCGLEFEIADADPRRIKLLRVRRFSPSAADGERTEKSGL